MTKNGSRSRRSNHDSRSLSCGLLARRRRHASGPRDRRSLTVVGARRRLLEGADGSLLASPGERRSPELAARGAANVRSRRPVGPFGSHPAVDCAGHRRLSEHCPVGELSGFCQHRRAEYQCQVPPVSTHADRRDWSQVSCSRVNSWACQWDSPVSRSRPESPTPPTF